MLSCCEVLVRILALLQRKTLIETKSRTLKCLKWHYSTVRSMKNVAVLMEDGAFALFFHPHPTPRGFDSSRVPTPGNLPSKAKKLLTFLFFFFWLHQLLGNQSTQEFEKLNIDLSDVNILSNETRNSLIDLGQSGVDEIDFDAFLNEVMIFCSEFSSNKFVQQSLSPPPWKGFVV